MSRSYRFESSQFIPRPRSEVFAFFSDAANLEKLTPPFLHFKILTPLPIVMQPGTLIDYQLRLYGIPLRWRTRIDTFVPEESFSDSQLKGPYKRWDHRHEFSDAPGGTMMRDTVEYELPFGPLGALARPIFVLPSLKQIFGYRHEAVERLLAGKRVEGSG